MSRHPMRPHVWGSVAVILLATAFLLLTVPPRVGPAQRAEAIQHVPVVCRYAIILNQDSTGTWVILRLGDLVQPAADSGLAVPPFPAAILCSAVPPGWRHP